MRARLALRGGGLGVRPYTCERLNANYSANEQ